MRITTFTEAQIALRAYHSTGPTKYNLDVILALLDYLGNPQDSMRVLHVAGTSGKTSTAYYAAALLKESGMTVGLTVSPHVDEINERLQINGSPLPEVEFCAVLSEFLELIAKAPVRPSYFELLIALAYWEFARRGLDYAVIEVGLGGLLDGTNVVSRPDKVCLITDIGLDHTAVLGNTLPKIAAQKAGIIHDGNQVFMYRQADEITDVIQTVINEQHAYLTLLGEEDSLDITTLPLFQQRNLGLALRAVEYVNQREQRPPLNYDQIEAAAAISVPARLEQFSFYKQRLFIDGSHNGQKMTAMVDSLKELYRAQPIAVLAAFVDGPDSRWQEALNSLLPAVEQVIFTGYQANQDSPKTAVDPDLLAQYCQRTFNRQCQVIPDPAAAFHTLLKQPQPLLLVTGSFYLLNHIRPLLINPSIEKVI